MRAHILTSLLLATAAFAQDTVTRTYTLTHASSAQDFAEMANLMRIIGEIKQFSTVDAQKTLVLTGTATQIGVADFLFQELDQAPQGQPTVTHQYTAAPDDIVRVFYLPSTQSIQEFQEMINGVRTIGEIRLAFGENEQHAFTIRGKPAQIAQADFILSDLTQATHSAASPQYRRQDGADRDLAAGDVTQAFYLTHTASIQDFQERANMIRTIAQIRRTIAINGPRAIVLRATPSEIAMAAWLVNEFEQSPTPAATPSYTAAPDDVVRVFYFPSTSTVQELQSTANAVRTAAKIRMAVAVNTSRAFTVRGTASQMALAEKLIADLSTPQPPQP
jgi:hypothetical protein